MPHSALEHYWSGDFLAANAFIGLHLVGALDVSVTFRPRFAVVAMERSRAVSPALLAEELAGSAGIASFGITPMRS